MRRGEQREDINHIGEATTREDRKGDGRTIGETGVKGKDGRREDGMMGASGKEQEKGLGSQEEVKVGFTGLMGAQGWRKPEVGTRLGQGNCSA